ncbi:MAG: hypothetical protein JNK72_19440 [Myxococcales bacterium]|nr:hypothetical protein [Myxococcales bacterium]
MADRPEDAELPPSTGQVDEDALEPMPRDTRFVVRLVLACLVGVIAAGFVGLKLQGAAGSCGRGLIAPGGSVIPSGGDAGQR